MFFCGNKHYIRGLSFFLIFLSHMYYLISYLMLFCVNVIGIDAIHFSVIIFICKALDALNDTFIGRVVDLRPGSKHGKFKPFILWFAIPYAVSTIILFLNIQSALYWFRIVYCLGIYFIWGIVGTFINVRTAPW